MHMDAEDMSYAHTVRFGNDKHASAARVNYCHCAALWATDGIRITAKTGRTHLLEIHFRPP